MKYIIDRRKVKQANVNKRCGAITCLHNFDGNCNIDSCEIFERTLQQEH